MSSRESEQNSLKILFVDDEEGILEALERQMGLYDQFKAIFTTNPLEVENMIQDQVIDVIVADVVMPEEDGITLLQRIKEKYPKIIRILLTGYGDYNTSLRAINDAEVFGFITKPWDQNYLIGHLNMAAHMINGNLAETIADHTPFAVFATWSDENEIDKIKHTASDDFVANQFSTRVFLTSAALFGTKYRFQNNLFTLPLKESGVVVRGLLENRFDTNFGVFIFSSEMNTDMRRKFDQTIGEIEDSLTTNIMDIELDKIVSF